MVERRENLAFGNEALVQLVGVLARAQDLHRNATTELSIVTLGEVHDAHAAAPELAQHAVRPDVAAAHWVRNETGEMCRGGTVEWTFRFVRGQQQLHFAAQTRIAATPRLEPHRTPLGRDFQRLVEDVFDQGAEVRLHVRRVGGSARWWPPRCGHVSAFSPNQRFNQARAFTQSRRTVRVVTPSASAISVSSSPAKKRHSTTLR